MNQLTNEISWLSDLSTQQENVMENPKRVATSVDDDTKC